MASERYVALEAKLTDLSKQLSQFSEHLATASEIGDKTSDLALVFSSL